jgi:hypothetical protein
MVVNSCDRDRFELGKAEQRTHHDGSKSQLASWRGGTNWIRIWTGRTCNLLEHDMTDENLKAEHLKDCSLALILGKDKDKDFSDT